MMTSYLPNEDLHDLQALRFGDTNKDTLLVWTTFEKREKLEELSEKWAPDSVDWLTEKEIEQEQELPYFMHVMRVGWTNEGAVKDWLAIRPPTEEWPRA